MANRATGKRVAEVISRTVPREMAGSICYEDLLNMLRKFLPTGQGKWTWVVTPSAYPGIVPLTGHAGIPSYVWTTNAAKGIPATLLGFPVQWNEEAPLIGTPGDVVLTDHVSTIIMLGEVW